MGLKLDFDKFALHMPPWIVLSLRCEFLKLLQQSFIAFTIRDLYCIMHAERNSLSVLDELSISYNSHLVRIFILNED